MRAPALPRTEWCGSLRVRGTCAASRQGAGRAILCRSPASNLWALNAMVNDGRVSTVRRCSHQVASRVRAPVTTCVLCEPLIGQRQMADAHLAYAALSGQVSFPMRRRLPSVGPEFSGSASYADMRPCFRTHIMHTKRCSFIILCRRCRCRRASAMDVRSAPGATPHSVSEQLTSHKLVGTCVA